MLGRALFDNLCLLKHSRILVLPYNSSETTPITLLENFARSAVTSFREGLHALSKVYKDWRSGKAAADFALPGCTTRRPSSFQPLQPVTAKAVSVSLDHLDLFDAMFFHQLSPKSFGSF
ncbi:hypothetical protein TNCV_360091 [Trichonephila clavipes]|uniref:Uncharacterized protein n=1 Tax=Trichonephila clavipes TaxID=2585209 RepID=A0A8X6S9Y9_TRICX|nr:hypothetical protein TNCV_360091 [Trichonephila clavipes]